MEKPNEGIPHKDEELESIRKSEILMAFESGDITAEERDRMLAGDYSDKGHSPGGAANDNDKLR